MSTRAVDWAGNLYWIDDLPGVSIQRPFAGDARISQAFGVRSVTGITHRGVDWVIPGDTEMQAADDGDAWFVREGSWPHYGPVPPYEGVDTSYGGYGNQAILRHAWGYTMYSHMRAVEVTSGQRVRRGQRIGRSNSTGISTGDHTHFEMRLPDNITRIDPLPYVDRVIEEDWYMALTPEGKVAADALFNDPARVKALGYALSVAATLATAKPGATPEKVGGDLVTLGPDGRMAVSLLSDAYSEIRRRNEPAVREAIEHAFVRLMRQWGVSTVPRPATGAVEPVVPVDEAEVQRLAAAVLPLIEHVTGGTTT